ncbi:BatA domain-containing protein [Pedobacter sp. KBW06]|uniref:BatA domain-containing protein n=1 Tax=Pedobacter sp. KBW06 TaxID=2153359 RepID=UPI001315A1E2|nr:BatA domain-containing protein [Pedobacter sp. KBW06]
MSLLYPIGLFALAGLVIPLIIHLWNVKQGKTLKIGSISLLGEAAPLSSRSYRITDWLLLLLRLLLIILLAFLLAEPYMRENAAKGDQKGWLMMEKQTFSLVYRTQKKSIDSLLKAGYELRRFEPGFSTINLNDTLTKDSLSHTETISYFSLLRQLNERLPAGFPVILYADQQLSKLSGALPEVDFNLQWKGIEKTDTVRNWTAVSALKIYEATSSPSLTSYRSLDTSKVPPLISVLLFKGANAEDGNYVMAALTAIADFTKRRIEVKQWNEQYNSDLKYDIGFWLSDQPVSDRFSKNINQAGRLFSYESGKTVAVHSMIDLQPGKTGNDAIVELNKRIAAGTELGESIWKDGFGQPVLSLEKEKSPEHYHFYSRLKPQWTTLVWSGQFVKALMPIVLGNEETGQGFGFERNPEDQRKSTPFLSQKQNSIPAATIGKESVTVPLNPFFWLLAMAVFLLERVLSFNHKNRLGHG